MPAPLAPLLNEEQFRTLAEAPRAERLAAFARLTTPGSQNFYNLGTGTPTSVLDVIKAVEKVSGLKVPASFAPRRAGDPPELQPCGESFTACIRASEIYGAVRV